ncbi:hypothetical protein EV644_11772 [Kribbella orskensis]|uniref:Uncharacterized protein n=1 Tax=Kribbella orskensis TaxID=2512216 RepID=A0ABY2BD42_9ACTN|nr:hypothetical protein EV642_11872 [Kribbella sp. VKM Ac-2500]TCO16418.1 hypothetical protein EV644_11772 [Kribbella orskensis]
MGITRGQAIEKRYASTPSCFSRARSSGQRRYESHATSPVSPLSIAPGTRQNVSQIDGNRPSASIAPSIWYAEVAVPQTKSCRSGESSTIGDPQGVEVGFFKG